MCREIDIVRGVIEGLEFLPSMIQQGADVRGDLVLLAEDLAKVSVEPLFLVGLAREKLEKVSTWPDGTYLTNGGNQIFDVKNHLESWLALQNTEESSAPRGGLKLSPAGGSDGEPGEGERCE